MIILDQRDAATVQLFSNNYDMIFVRGGVLRYAVCIFLSIKGIHPIVYSDQRDAAAVQLFSIIMK